MDCTYLVLQWNFWYFCIPEMLGHKYANLCRKAFVIFACDVLWRKMFSFIVYYNRNCSLYLSINLHFISNNTQGVNGRVWNVIPNRIFVWTNRFKITIRFFDYYIFNDIIYKIIKNLYETEISRNIEGINMYVIYNKMENWHGVYRGWTWLFFSILPWDITRKLYLSRIINMITSHSGNVIFI